VRHVGEPIAGVIGAPCHNEIYAAAGKGAKLNGKTLMVDPSRTIRNALTGIGTNSYATPDFVAGIVGRLLAEGGNFIRNGSGALMLGYVAAGRLVGYLRTLHACSGLPGELLPREGGQWIAPPLPDAE